MFACGRIIDIGEKSASKLVRSRVGPALARGASLVIRHNPFPPPGTGKVPAWAMGSGVASDGVEGRNRIHEHMSESADGLEGRIVMKLYHTVLPEARQRLHTPTSNRGTAQRNAWLYRTGDSDK